MVARKTCLLITEQFEPTADLLIGELRRRDVSCVRWNLERFPADSCVTYNASRDGFAGWISTDGRRINLDTIGSVWCRGFKPAGLPKDIVDADRNFAASESQRALDALMTILDVVWINHPQNHARANSKPAQLLVARRVGLDIPPTVITNDAAEVLKFIATVKGEVVYKALSQTLNLQPGMSLFTGLVTEKELRRLEVIRATPGIFQALMPKSYEVRVTVVGRDIFSGKIDSQAYADTRLDWRHRPFDMEDRPIELPAEVESKVHDLMNTFGLIYGALDFIVTPEGRFVFLEINPAGQYMWVESRTGLPITNALADLLSDACKAN